MVVRAQHLASQEWQISSPEEISHDDPLLECLLVLTRIFDQPHTGNSLTAGLPLVDNCLTPDLFIRAATRAGLSARLAKKPLKNIPPTLLPAVLLLRDRRACVVLEINAAEQTARILRPETGLVEEVITLGDLDSEYCGNVLFVRPKYRLDERAPNVLASPTRHWFWAALFRNWRTYVDVLVASLFINIFALAMPFFILNVYDRVVPNNAIETLWVLAIGVGLIGLFELVLRGLRAFFIDRAARKTDTEISSLLFERVLGIKAEARPPSVGSFANNLQEFEGVRDFITSTTITAVIDLPFAIVFLLAIWWIGGPIVWVPAAAIPIILLYALVVQWPMRRAVEKSYRASSQRHATLVESLIGNEMIKTLCAESQQQRTWEQAVSYIARWRNRIRLLSSSTTNFTLFMGSVSVIGTVIVGVYLVSFGALTLGGLVACVILSRHAISPMARVTNVATHYFHARSALQSLNRIVDLPIERPYGKTYVNRPDIAGGIEFENVSFKYSGNSSEILQNVDFSIKPGEHVAIIGRIGSGKTTLGKLLLGLYEPTAGAVCVDGIDIRQIDPIDLRSNIGYVPQDMILMYGSIRDNVTLGARYVDDNLIIRATEIAGVSDFTDKNPMGLDMDVGERGAKLSGGQRQGVIIARALLLTPPIFLMDEPTNSMDNRTEQQLIASLSNALQGKSLVLITHRTSLLELVDRVIVLDEGRVVADGPKEQVLEAIAQGEIRTATRKS